MYSEFQNALHIFHLPACPAVRPSSTISLAAEISDSQGNDGEFMNPIMFCPLHHAVCFRVNWCSNQGVLFALESGLVVLPVFMPFRGWFYVE